MKPVIHVVAGLLTKVIEGDPLRYLIGQRREGDSNAGKWEFPGGKVEEGEEPRAALERELQEELGINVRVGALFGVTEFESDRARFHLELYECQYLSGKYQLLEHAALEWVTLAELAHFDMLSGDRPFIIELNARQKDKP